jgi:beta-lactam-binding protein with PASTA domain
MPTPVQVPNVGGRSRDGSAATLLEAGFKVAFTDVSRFSPAGAGTAATQSPAPGTLALPGTTVVVGIATGLVEVPSVAGLSGPEAAAVLSSASFQVRTTRRGSTKVAPGMAITSNPGAGVLLLPGTTIELLVSQGR